MEIDRGAPIKGVKNTEITDVQINHLTANDFAPLGVSFKLGWFGVAVNADGQIVKISMLDLDKEEIKGVKESGTILQDLKKQLMEYYRK